MSLLLRLRASQLALVYDLDDASAPTQAQVVALLQRGGKLRPPEADRLECGLYWTLFHLEVLLQRFLEAGGLAPLLEHTIRPGADQLLEQAVGSCPPVKMPMGGSVLVPRAAILKAVLVQVLSDALFSKTALPSLRATGRSEAVAGLARLSVSGQEHELVQVVAMLGLSALVRICSPKLVAPLQQVAQQRGFFDACCRLLRTAVAPPAGSLMEADAGFLLEATGSASTGAVHSQQWKAQPVVLALALAMHLPEERAELPPDEALAALELLVGPAAQAAWRSYTQHQAAIAALPPLRPGASAAEDCCRQYRCEPLTKQAAFTLEWCAHLLIRILATRQPDWQACRALLPPRPFLEQVVRACRKSRYKALFKNLDKPYGHLLLCSLAPDDGAMAEAVFVTLQQTVDEHFGAVARGEHKEARGVTQHVAKGAPKDVLEGWRSCVHCNAPEGKDVKMRVCSACRSVWYCSQECQKAAWPGHKAACKKLVAQNEGTGTSGAAAS